MSDDSPQIVTHRDNAVATVLLRRPAKLNALTPMMVRQLREVFDRVGSGDGVRAVVLAGEGRAFAAGADIAHYATATPEGFASFQEECGTLCHAIESAPVPVIAAVQGLALGGGFELVLSSDLVVAGKGARFGLPEVALGLAPGWGGTQKLTRLIGRNRAKHLIMTGARLSAARAEDLGIVTTVVEDGDEVDTARKIARTLAESAPLAVRGIKRAINDGIEAPLHAALTIEREILNGLFSTEDGKEGIKAFVEKRTPEYHGR